MERMTYRDIDLAMGPEPQEHPAPGMHVWGWMSSVELMWLNEQAQRMSSVVEVGALRGRSSYALISGCPGPVYCIDPFNDPGDYAYTDWQRNCGHFPNAHPIRGYSPAAGEAKVITPLGKHSTVDMVFIDGDHSYDSIKADVEFWLPLTNKLICGHDYGHEGYPDVKRYIDEIAWSLDIQEFYIPERTSIWAFDLEGV